MKFHSLAVFLITPLAVHAWTGHVFNNIDDCKRDCSQKCIDQKGVWDGCSGGDGSDVGGMKPVLTYCHCRNP